LQDCTRGFPQGNFAGATATPAHDRIGDKGTGKMLEINAQLTKLKELKTRTDTLRGYL